MPKSILTIVLSFLTTISFCQEPPIQDFFKPKMPTHIDTLYYPFYKGVQMIEVDHLGYWDRKIYYLEQSNPRAMPHSMQNPQPLGNEFFFRDATGKIIKAYNTLTDLATLTQQFSHIPIHQKNSGFLSLLPNYHVKNGKTEGVWVYSPQSAFLFNGYYKVSNQNAWANKRASGIVYGLIDTLGNIKVPIVYEEIYPLQVNLIVKQKGKWGIMNKEQQVIVPLVYDSFDNYYSKAENNKFIFFLKGKQYVAGYNVVTNSFVPMETYDRFYEHYINLGYLLVQKNGLFGLTNLKGKIVLPAIYNRINNINKKGGRHYYASAVKDEKTVEVKLK